VLIITLDTGVNGSECNYCVALHCHDYNIQPWEMYSVLYKTNKILTWNMCHMIHFSSIWYFFIWPCLTLLHWKLNVILHHKVYPPCFIILWQFEWMNEYVLDFLYGDLTLHGGHLQRWVVSINLPLHYLRLVFTGIWKYRLPSSANLSVFIYLPLDIKKNS
jgi:hypothetical protein